MALRDTLLLALLVSTTGVAFAAGSTPDFGAFVAAIGLLLGAAAYAHEGLSAATTSSDAPARGADED